MTYFEKYGYDKNLVPYDVEYALRVCIEKQGILNQPHLFVYISTLKIYLSILLISNYFSTEAMLCFYVLCGRAVR